MYFIKNLAKDTEEECCPSPESTTKLVIDYCMQVIKNVTPVSE